MSEDLRVLYNDTCPVCRFEMDSYRRRALSENLPIRFEDLSQAGCWGLTEDQAARRLHVIHKGQLLSGLPAQQAIWEAMPGWLWLARLTRLPGVRQVTAFAYDRIFAPLLYLSHRRRQRRAAP